MTGDAARPMTPRGFVDPVIGRHAAVAIQAALEHRRRTGEGQMIEVAQLEVGVNLTVEQLVDWVRASPRRVSIRARRRQTLPGRATGSRAGRL